MKTGVCLEYLGDVATELLLQNLTNTNPAKSFIDGFKEAFPLGFMVSAQIEMRIYETPEENQTLMDFVRSRLQRASRIDVLEPPGRQLLGLVLTPRTAQDK